MQAFNSIYDAFVTNFPLHLFFFLKLFYMKPLFYPPPQDGEPLGGLYEQQD